ncbi:UNVERIFIED_CONTAM: hypothetical protein Sradi_5862300 [Sesamum radiatum]|uniref:Uncharacterized protein n=1 Tax=Sesamum radiatum TaxID=300843 RepID=A0AAW2KQH4_SESRA
MASQHAKNSLWANGYPPNGEEPSFLDLGAAMEHAPEPFTHSPIGDDILPDSGNINVVGVLCRGDSGQCPGEVTTDMKRGPLPAATIDSIAGDLPEEGVKEPQEGGVPSAIVEGLLTVTVGIPSPSDKTEEKNGLAYGDDKEEM